MSVLHLAVATLMLVAGCNATTLEVAKDHPAHPSAPEAPALPTSRVLAQDFDALEYGGAPSGGGHAHHGHHAAAPAPSEAPSEPAPADGGAAKPGHDHGTPAPKQEKR